MPGLVNAHHHNLRPNRPKLLESPLELSLLQLRRRRLPPLTDDEERDHTLWAAHSLLRTGVTTVIDCFSADPSRGDFGLAVNLDAYLESGMRAALCVRCSDQLNFSYEDDEIFWRRLALDPDAVGKAKPAPFDADRFFDVCEAIARDYDKTDGRIRIGYGPTGELWCSDSLLDRINDAAAARDAPVQIHLLESPFQAAAARDRYGQTAVARLHGRRFLGPKTSLAHSIWVTTEDIEIIRDAGSVIVNNPASNLRFGNGIAPVSRMRAMGCAVGLGLDANGFEPMFDMFREMRLTMLLQREPGWNGAQMSPLAVLEMATLDGSAAAAMPASIGHLEEGSAADLIMIDRNELSASPYGDPEQSLTDAVVTGGTPAAIDCVIVAGHVVMERGGKSDEAFLELTSRVRNSVARFLPLLDEADAEFRLMAPHVDAYFRQLDLGTLGVRPGDRNLGPSESMGDRDS
jgi:5-methylthioadenosine/S-adenosylhomocysteine deaminase